MSDEERNDGDFHIVKRKMNCNFCRCGKKNLHKETKTTTDEDGNVIVSKIEDRSSWRIGNGRGITPNENEIFKTNIHDEEDVYIVDTGFGKGKHQKKQKND